MSTKRPERPRFRAGLRQGLLIVLLAGLAQGFYGLEVHSQKNSTGDTMIRSKFELEPLGRVEQAAGKTIVAVRPEYAAALDGIEGFSHVWIIYWFHGNDTPEKRRVLKVHPRRNPANPLTGVLATRSPSRPNLVGLQACRLVRRDGHRLEVEGLDAWEGSPVVDIKPYLPQLDSHPQAAMPRWAEGRAPE